MGLPDSQVGGDEIGTADGSVQQGPTGEHRAGMLIPAYRE
jgi:hypothetical protein